MKLLVFAHQLEIGGTQTNAIDLAAALRDRHGFDVVLFATPGPAVSIIEQKRLRYVAAPDGLVHPSPARVRALRDVVRSERPDVIHAWDWWQCLDAYYVEHLLRRIPLVVSDMNMTLTRILPKRLPTTFGTPELVDLARNCGWTRAQLLLPPVDVGLNNPTAVEPEPFRAKWQIDARTVTLVSVSRLDLFMKAESLHRTVAAVRTLGRELPLRFLIVGDGEGRGELERAAQQANSELGRTAVVLTGAMLDPRPAYAAADIVVGMGGSAIRGMAFAKPVVVVGERGFSAPLNDETAEYFYYKGIYGSGTNAPGNQAHVSDLRRLASRRERFPALGAFARDFVVRHFGIDAGALRLAEICREAAAAPVQGSEAAVDGFRTAALLMRERRFVSNRFWMRVRRTKTIERPAFTAK